MPQVEIKKLTPKAYELHRFMLDRCVGELDAMSANDLVMWLSLTSTRELRYLRAEINAKDSPIQRKILTSKNGYYIALSVDSEDARKQYRKVGWRKIKQGVKYIMEGKGLLEHADLDGQMRLQLTEYMKPVIEIASRIKE